MVGLHLIPCWRGRGWYAYPGIWFWWSVPLLWNRLRYWLHRRGLWLGMGSVGVRLAQSLSHLQPRQVLLAEQLVLQPQQLLPRRRRARRRQRRPAGRELGPSRRCWAAMPGGPGMMQEVPKRPEATPQRPIRLTALKRLEDTPAHAMKAPCAQAPFSGYDHGGDVRSFSSRGSASLRGGGGGGPRRRRRWAAMSEFCRMATGRVWIWRDARCS